MKKRRRPEGSLCSPSLGGGEGIAIGMDSPGRFRRRRRGRVVRPLDMTEGWNEDRNGSIQVPRASAF